MSNQLRGKMLEDAVRKAIMQLVKEAGKKGVIKINTSRIAEAVGTSRTTLYKMNDFVDRCITEAKAERRLSDGSSERIKLEMKVKTLQATILGLTNKLQGVRQHHVDLYRRMYASSSDLAELVKSNLVLESNDVGVCVLCGHRSQGAEGTHKRSNVVKLTKPTSI